MKKSCWVIVVWGLIATVFLPCGWVLASDGDLHWCGCGICQKAFLKEAAEAYYKATGKVVSIVSSGDTLGIRAIAAGKADIGGACRPVKPDLTDLEKGVKMIHIGWDALVVMVNPENPISSLTIEQLHGIMTGEIKYWDEVGGTRDKILVVVRIGKMSGVGYMARQMLFKDARADYDRHAIKLSSSGPVEKKVARRKFAIGISGVSSAKRRKVKLLALNGIFPTKGNVASGIYPFFRPLYLVTKGDPKGDARLFCNWLLAPQGQRVVSKQGTVNLIEGRELSRRYQYWENTDLIWNFQK